jgi:hypothetical protein
LTRSRKRRFVTPREEIEGTDFKSDSK